MKKTVFFWALGLLGATGIHAATLTHSYDSGKTAAENGTAFQAAVDAATAGDEISATRDPRVLSNPSYLTIVILSRVVTELEGLEMVNATVIERLFTADLAFLQDMYQRINDIEPPVMTAVCPDCGKTFEVPLNFTGEG